MIIVTGAAGFIGSVVTRHLQQLGKEIVLVDDFSPAPKRPNWEQKSVRERVERSKLANWLEQLDEPPEAIVHLGARTDTAEQNWGLFLRLNLYYSQMIWAYCTQHQVPLVYASSAATYGGGEHGFSDDHAGISQLAPLNPYGRSKQEFDQWVLGQTETPPFFAGLKFFNVYGPNEYHKGRMASVIFHAFNQIQATNQMKLFRSHRPDFEDGAQSRDFIYVMDVAKVIGWLLEKQPASGIYNLGTGQARTFMDLVRGVFAALDLEEAISFIDTPEDIRETYQYFTEADMGKLRGAGYTEPFTSLEDGITEYVQQFLLQQVIY